MMCKEMKLSGKLIFNNNLFETESIMDEVEKMKKRLKKVSFLKSDEIIAVYLDRNPKMIISICALFEDNIPFLMLNNTLPIRRIEYMLENSNVNTVLTLKKYKNKFLEKRVIYVDNTEDEWGEISNIREKDYKTKKAYILYTSGSTGNPKGVLINRCGLINFIKSIQRIININNNSMVGCFTNCTFDIFFLETFAALYSGATVVLADDSEINNVKKMIKLINESGINFLQLTPSRLRMIQMIDSKYDCMKNVNIILVGGEKLTEDLLFSLQQNTFAEIYNMYGPTETTIWSTISNLTNSKCVDIGRPIDNTEIFIFGENQQLLDIGEQGEICISGYGLADGYVNNIKLTEESFVNVNVCGHKKRIYRTGDIGYYREDGRLVYLGRLDNQIKYNGHRIELEEIEAMLINIDGILNAAVCYDEENNLLIAFCVTNTIMCEHSINKYISELLPQYMCPNKYFFVKKLLYTESGKVNRKALVAECKSDNHKMLAEENVCSCNLIKREIMEIFSRIMNKSIIEVSDNTSLSEMGITSMQFVNIIVELEVKFDIEFEDEKLSVNAFNTFYDIYMYVIRIKSDSSEKK